MYTPQNESELKKDVDFDINHRVADFEAIRLRLDNPEYEKAFMQALEDKYQKTPQIEARSSFFEEIRTISKNSMEFIKRYFERLDAAILSKDKGQSIAPAVYQSIADKQTQRNEIDTWVKNSSQNPAYREQFTLAQKDLDLYFKGDISIDEMRRKSQNSLYHTAFEDNLRLQAYATRNSVCNKPKRRLPNSALNHCVTAQKNRSSILPKRPLIHLKNTVMLKKI